MKPYSTSINTGKLFLDKRDDGYYWTAYGREDGPFIDHRKALGAYRFFMYCLSIGDFSRYIPAIERR